MLPPRIPLQIARGFGRFAVLSARRAAGIAKFERTSKSLVIGRGSPKGAFKKLSLRIVGSTLLVAVCVLGILTLVHQDAQAARPLYSCCQYVVRDAGGVRMALGVWFDGKCRCAVFYLEDNPNNCPLYCPWPL